jgi:hypothetical protein
MKADCALPDDRGRTPLMCAWEVNGEISHKLLEVKMETPDENKEGSATPSYTSKISQNEIMFVLSKTKMDTDIMMHQGTPPFKAYINRHINTIKTMLREKMGVDKFFYYVGLFDDKEVVDMIVGSIKRNIDRKANNMGMTSFFIASYCSVGNYAMKALLEKKADVDARNKFGSTPLLTIINKQINEIEKIKFLINAKANVNTRCNTDTVLLCAIRQNNEEVISLLLQAKADVSKPGGNKSPFTAASECGNEKIIKMLLAADTKKNNSLNG